MRKFDAQQAIARLEIEQRLTDYWDEIDIHGGRDVAAFFTTDCTGNIGPVTLAGSASVAAYYVGRAARAVDASGAPRTGRHCFSNLRVVFEDGESVSLRFTLVSYAGFGTAFIPDATLPISVSSVAILCRRDGEGAWCFARYQVDPLLVQGTQLAARASASS